MTTPSDFPRDAIAAVTHPDPYPYYAALVERRPFHRDEQLNLWIAASHAAIREVLESRVCHVRPETEPVPRHLGDGAAAAVFSRLMRMTEDAARDRLKAKFLRSLSALTLAQIATVASDTMAQLCATHRLDGAAVDALLFALPVRCMAALLGLPAEVQITAAGCTGDFVHCLLPQATPEQIARGDDAAETLLGLLRSHRELGLLAMLLDESDDTAILANALGLLMQSHDATAGLIGNGLVAVQRHPECRETLRSDPALVPAFVREVMRFDPPVQNTRRFVAEDCRIQGHDVRQGDAVLVLLAAASRDPGSHDEPNRFRLDRHSSPLIGFGHGGHACAGPEIASAIAAAGIQYWVNRDLAIPPAIGYRPSANARIPYFNGQ